MGLILILHIPSFHPDFYLDEESLVLNCAKRLINSEGTLYIDAWYPGPPLVVWLYRGWYFLFGSYSLTLMHITLCFYKYIIVVYFSSVIFFLKTHGRYIGFIPFLLAFLLSTPWHNQELNHTMLTLLPVTFAFLTFLNPERGTRSQNYNTLFQIGAGIMIGIFFSYKIIIMLLGVLVTYLIIRNPKVDEVVAMMGGVLSVLIFFLVILYFNGNLNEYWDQGILYFWDKVRLDDPISTRNLNQAINMISWNWGGWFLLAVVGIIHFRLRFYSYVVKIRLAERIMSIWLLFGMIGIMVKQENIEIQDFILIAPPISFYAVKGLEMIKKRRIQSLMLTISFVPALLIFVHFWRPLHFLPDSRFFRSILDRSPIEFTEEKARVHQYLKQHAGSVWILNEWDDLYHRLDTYAPNKYTDFAMTYNKLPFWGNTQKLVSAEENVREIFMELASDTPRWIVDPLGIFPAMKARFPTLLSNYHLIEGTDLLIYERKM